MKLLIGKLYSKVQAGRLLMKNILTHLGAGCRNACISRDENSSHDAAIGLAS